MQLVKKAKQMCTDCFKNIAGIALLDGDFLTYKFLNLSKTSANNKTSVSI